MTTICRLTLTGGIVYAGGREVKLRPTEYRLLYHLINNAGWVMTHENLLSKVWGYEYREESQYLRLYITLPAPKDRTRPGSSALHPHRARRGVSFCGLEAK